MFADIAGTELVDSETPKRLDSTASVTKSLLVAGPVGCTRLRIRADSRVARNVARMMPVSVRFR